MVSYEYKPCVRCGQEFYEPLEFPDDEPTRLLCDVCESIDPNPHSNTPPYKPPTYKLSKHEIARLKRRFAMSTEELDAEIVELSKSHFRSSSRACNERARMRGVEGLIYPDDLLVIYNTQNGECAYCKRRLTRHWEADHVIPLSRGGTNWADNIVIACMDCNRRKNNKTGVEWLRIMNS